ncbi:MAG: CofD-related protein of GAK system, partial [Yoonia sp.]
MAFSQFRPLGGESPIATPTFNQTRETGASKIQTDSFGHLRFNSRRYGFRFRSHMKFISITAEFLVIGLTILFAGCYVGGKDSFIIINISDQLDGEQLVGVGFLFLAALPFMLSVAFLLGFAMHLAAERVFRSMRQGIESDCLEGRGDLKLRLDDIRHELYLRGGAEVCRRLEAESAYVRIAGALAVGGGGLFLLAIAMGKPVDVAVFGALVIACVFAIRRHVTGGADTAIRSWSAIQRNTPKVHDRPASDSASLVRLEDGVSVRLLIFAGGTGFRNCNIALARRGHRVTRVVPPWDSGGSSRTLRNEFGVMSIGDLRHALMTMAHGERISNEVIRLFNWRLSEDGEQEQLLMEMDSFLKQQHPLIANVPTDLRNVILKYLETFWSQRPESLDLYNGSIGNLVMLGAYLAHGNDMNTAIYVFRQLCGIKGHVWPISLENDLHISARLENGEVVVREENVTAIRRPEISSRIDRTFLMREACEVDGGNLSVASNPLVINAFGNVDAIVFGPGSFFSSVVPHLMVSGVVDKLAKSSAPKIFVGNMLEGNECFGWSVAELVEKFLQTCHDFAAVKR